MLADISDWSFQAWEDRQTREFGAVRLMTAGRSETARLTNKLTSG